MKNKKIFVLFSVLLILIVNAFAVVSVSANDVCDSYGHRWVNGNCTECGIACTHQNWDGDYCRDCGIFNPSSCTHSNMQGRLCLDCGLTLGNDESGGNVDCAHSLTKKIYSPVNSIMHVEDIRCNDCGVHIDYGAISECSFKNNESDCVCGNKCPETVSSGISSKFISFLFVISLTLLVITIVVKRRR